LLIWHLGQNLEEEEQGIGVSQLVLLLTHFVILDNLLYALSLFC